MPTPAGNAALQRTGENRRALTREETGVSDSERDRELSEIAKRETQSSPAFEKLRLAANKEDGQTGREGHWGTLFSVGN